jgi:hypothetical protein
VNGLVVKKLLYFELADGEALVVNGDYFCLHFLVLFMYVPSLLLLSGVPCE